MQDDSGTLDSDNMTFRNTDFLIVVLTAFSLSTILKWNFLLDVPVFWVHTEKRGQHHHLIFTGSDLSDRQDLMLGLWMTDVQHGGGARLVLFKHTRSPVSHLQWVVRSQLTLYILSGHLNTSEGRGDRKVSLSTANPEDLVGSRSCIIHLPQPHFLILHSLPLQLFLHRNKTNLQQKKQNTDTAT